MRFSPKNEMEIKNMGLLPEGKYAFEVIEAQEQVSRAGNEMIKLQLKIIDSTGRPYTIYDYIMEKMEYKLLHFCQATGLYEKYNAGELTDQDCIGKNGHVEIYIQEDTSGQYPNKNSVKDYIVSKSNDPKNPLHPENQNKDIVADFFNDDVPF